MPRTDPVRTKPRSAARLPDARTPVDNDWRAGALVRLRRLIEEADSEAVEQQKWKKPSNPAGVPVWYHDGILCHLQPLKNRVRLTFANGASLRDPKGLFNACRIGNSMRAIDIGETDEVDEAGIRSLVREAAARNASEARG